MLLRKLTPFLVLALAVLPVSAVSWNPLEWFDEPPPDFSEPTPEALARSAQLMAEAEAAVADGRKKVALKRWETVYEELGNTPEAADALYNAGTTLKELGKYRKAFETYQQLVNRYPGYPEFQKVIEAQYRIAVTYMEGQRDKILWIFPGFANPQTAIAYFEIVINNAPYSPLAPTSLMYIALIAERNGDRELAIDALDRLITFYPRSVLTSDAYFTLAQVFASLIDGPYYDQGSTLKAMNYYADFLILFPRSRFAADAEEGLAKVRDIHARSKLVIAEYYYVHQKNDEAATTYYNEAITVAPDSAAADFARERLKRINAGDRRPMLSETVASDSLYDSVEDFFDARWDEYDAEEAAAADAERVRERYPAN